MTTAPVTMVTFLSYACHSNPMPQITFFPPAGGNEQNNNRSIFILSRLSCVFERARARGIRCRSNPEASACI